MRLHRWLSRMTGMVLVSASALAQAQDYPGSMSAGAFYAPPPGAGYPQYYQPWPSVSPYSPDYSQLRQQDGLWQYDTRSQSGMPSRFRLRTEYMRMAPDRGRNLIGNPNAPNYRQQIAPILRDSNILGGGGGGGGGQNNAQNSYLNALTGQNGSGTFNLYDPITGKDVEDSVMDGVRLTLEMESVDGSQWEMWGMWAQDTNAEFDARDNVAQTRGRQPDLAIFVLENGSLNPDGTTPSEQLGPFNDRIEVLMANLLNLRGIPLDDGTLVHIGNGVFQGGGNAIYDLDFRVGVETVMYGTGLRFMSRPFWQSGNFRMSVGGGARYTQIGEDFGFFGRDSGALYGAGGTGNNNAAVIPDLKLHSLPDGFDNDGDGIVDNAGLIEGGTGQGGGGGNNQTAQFTLFSLDNLSPNGELYPVTSILNNEVRTHLVGPEAAINYQFGDNDGFRLGGRSTFAVMANYSTFKLNGDNIFVTTRLSNLNVPSPANPNPNAFSREESHNSVSPLFEQSVYFEGPLFQYVPLLRRSKLLRGADFRLDYTFTFIGEVARASDSILWQGNPSQNIFPDIQIERSSWRSDTWNFGVTWKW